MRPEYSLYGLDDIYLYETSLIYYSPTTGEIFVRGNPLSKTIWELSLQKYVELLYDEYEDRLLKKFLKTRDMNKYVEKLVILHSFNGYQIEHFLYIIMRSNGVGFDKAIDIVRDISCRKWLFRSLLMDGYKSGICLKNCPRSWKMYVRPHIPKWILVEREIIYGYLRNMPDILEKFKFFDRRIMKCVRDTGILCGGVYIRFLGSVIKDFPVEDVIVNSKLMVAEALYREYKRSIGRDIIIPPLYKGMARM